MAAFLHLCNQNATVMSAPIKPDPRLISFNTLRKAVGWLGLLLPAAMIVGNLFFGHCKVIQDSNSHYYYTVTGSVFVGILCAVGLFLLSYKGYPDDPRDKYCSAAAGICAILIAFFPTNDNSTGSCAVIHLENSTVRNDIHFISATLFFLLLAYMSYFLFTKSKGTKTKRKELRNRLYRWCGVLIVVFIGMIALYSFVDSLAFLSKYKPIFWLEWFALIAFGGSWLIKGELILKDNP